MFGNLDNLTNLNVSLASPNELFYLFVYEPGVGVVFFDYYFELLEDRAFLNLEVAPPLLVCGLSAD